MELLGFYGDLIGQLFTFQLPFFGLTFGALVVGFFGVPILVHTIRKFF